MKTSCRRLLITAFIVTALLMAAFSGGSAEETRPVFEGVWSEYGIHMVIDREDDLYHVSIDWGDGEFAHVSELECRYDEKNNCLTGSGTSTDDETGETTEEKDVTLIINDDDMILISSPGWNVEPIEALYTGKFEGVWQGENQTIRIDTYGGEIYCTVEEQGPGSRNEWYYECEYDAETGNAVSVGGSKRLVTGWGYEEERTYTEDPVKAVFSITGNDCLIWNDLQENAGEGRSYERTALYESPFGFTIRYPEKLVEAMFEPAGNGNFYEADTFTPRNSDSSARVICRSFDDPQYPFWTENGYQEVKTDDSLLDQIALSMNMSLRLYRNPDESEVVEELRLEQATKNGSDLVFDLFVPAKDPENWQGIFESMLKTLYFPPLGETRFAFELHFCPDEDEDQEYTAIISEDKDYGPYTLLSLEKEENFVLEKVEWDMNTLIPRVTKTLYSEEELPQYACLKIYDWLYPDPLPTLRMRFTDSLEDNRCIYLTGSNVDYSLHLVDEEYVLQKYWFNYTADNGQKYESFEIVKMHYDSDHKVTAVTGEFVHLFDDGESCDAETAEDGKLFTYSLAKNFHADMKYSQYVSPISTVLVTDLHQWYVDTYMDEEKPERDELTFWIDMTEEGNEEADFGAITTWIVLNEDNEIYYMRQRPVPWE